jgi:hypothetical protein
MSDSQPDQRTDKVVMSDAGWRAELTPGKYRVKPEDG